MKAGVVYKTEELFRSVEDRLGPTGEEELDHW